MKVESHELIYIRVQWDRKDPIGEAFQNWLHHVQPPIITPCAIGGGSGTFNGSGYYKADAERIFTWLREHGVDVQEPFDQWAP